MESSVNYVSLSEHVQSLAVSCTLANEALN